MSTYKIVIWQNMCISDVYESNSIESIRQWWLENWHGIWDNCQCAFYVYKDYKEMSFEELFSLGFYG